MITSESIRKIFGQNKFGLSAKNVGNNESVPLKNKSVAVEIDDKEDSVFPPISQNVDNKVSAVKEGNKKRKTQKQKRKEKTSGSLSGDEKIKEIIRKLESTGLEYLTSKNFVYNQDRTDKNNDDYISSGSFGDVFKCKVNPKKASLKHHEGKEYALKKMKFVYEQYNNQSLDDIMKEIKIHAMVREHRNIVTLIAYSAKRSITTGSVNDDCNCLHCTVGERFYLKN